MSVPPLLVPDRFYAGPQPTLRGDGLVLRDWRREDLDAVVRAYEDPDIRHWHVRSLSRQAAMAWIASRRTRWRERAGADWAVAAEAAPGTLLARVGLHRIELGQGLGVLAYWTLPEARGRRIVPRAIELVCGWAFGEQGMHRLQLEHSVLNEPSCRVAQRAGFALEGTERAAMLHADGWHDMHLHARLAGDPTPDARGGPSR